MFSFDIQSPKINILNIVARQDERWIARKVFLRAPFSPLDKWGKSKIVIWPNFINQPTAERRKPVCSVELISQYYSQFLRLDTYASRLFLTFFGRRLCLYRFSFINIEVELSALTCRLCIYRDTLDREVCRLSIFAASIHLKSSVRDKTRLETLRRSWP